jgi:hypothetical protein
LLAIVVSVSWGQTKSGFSRVLILYGIAALLPNPLLGLWKSRYQSPSFFSSARYREVLRPGENIMVFPFGVNGPSMMWQAETAMYFSMSGGYIGPTPDEFARWPAVNAALFSLPLTNSRRQFQTYLEAHKIEALVVADDASALATSLRIKPVRIGGVSVYRLPAGPGNDLVTANLDQLEGGAAKEWTGDLLRAAIRFLDGGGDLAELSPSRLQRLGLLPNSKWGETLDMVLAGASHGAITGLWIGPGPNRALVVGTFASPSTVAALASYYRVDDTAIRYPYPSPYCRRAISNDDFGFMLMTVRTDDARLIPGVCYGPEQVKENTEGPEPNAGPGLLAPARPQSSDGQKAWQSDRGTIVPSLGCVP